VITPKRQRYPEYRTFSRFTFHLYFTMMQFDKFFQVIVIQRVGLTQTALWVQLIIPDIFSGFPFLEK